MKPVDKAYFLQEVRTILTSIEQLGGNGLNIEYDFIYTELNEDYRSEEHTSELQSHLNLVCRLLLEKSTAITFSLLSCYVFVDIFLTNLPGNGLNIEYDFIYTELNEDYISILNEPADILLT